MKKRGRRWANAASGRSSNHRNIALVMVALILAGGSFAFASKVITINGTSLFAAVYSVITGQPMLVVNVSSYTPTGNIRMGSQTMLAAYDISIKNVTHWATVGAVPLQISIDQSDAASLSFSNLSMKYTYCIPTGALYGYGFRSGGCSTMTLQSDSNQGDRNNLSATFYTSIPVYPQQSSGQLSVYGTPRYAYTGTASNPRAQDATFRVSISGIRGSGDQCYWSRNWVPEVGRYGYGYTNCRASQLIPSVSSVSTGWIRVLRPYGYGYYPKPTIVQSPPPTPPTVVYSPPPTFPTVVQSPTIIYSPPSTYPAPTPPSADDAQLIA